MKMTADQLLQLQEALLLKQRMAEPAEKKSEPEPVLLIVIYKAIARADFNAKKKVKERGQMSWPEITAIMDSFQCKVLSCHI